MVFIMVLKPDLEVGHWSGWLLNRVNIWIKIVIIIVFWVWPRVRLESRVGFTIDLDQRKNKNCYYNNYKTQLGG
jgi:hypothetical protein